MSIKKDFKTLLLKLSKDEELRRVLEQIRGPVSGGAGAGAGAMQLLLLSGRFLGKSRARKVGDLIEVVSFLVTLSLIVKKNVFDKPEVREFLAKYWDLFSAQTQATFTAASNLVEKRLKKIKSRVSKTINKTLD